jgi:hypothetical protein
VSSNELAKKKEAGRNACLLQQFALAQDLFFLGRFHATVVPGLRFGVFHGFFGFGDFLGAGFGTPLAFFVGAPFAAQQFKECLVVAIALIAAQKVRKAPQ